MLTLLSGNVFCFLIIWAHIKKNVMYMTPFDQLHFKIQLYTRVFTYGHWSIVSSSCTAVLILLIKSVSWQLQTVAQSHFHWIRIFSNNKNLWIYAIHLKLTLKHLLQLKYIHNIHLTWIHEANLKHTHIYLVKIFIINVT